MTTFERKNRELLKAVDDADKALSKVWNLLRANRRDLDDGFAEKQGALIAPIQAKLSEELGES